MTGLQSMTGFASASAAEGDLRVTCEMRSVNGKGLDVKLRLPPGLDRLDPAIRKAIGAAVARGNIQCTIIVERGGDQAAVTIDEAAFAAAAKTACALAEKHGLERPSADAILSLRGMVTSGQDNSVAAGDDPAVDAIVAGCVADAAEKLAAMRCLEGTALKQVLGDQMGQLESLVAALTAEPTASPQAIRERLSARIGALLGEMADGALDTERLHAEAALLATKADLREETDRLQAHIAAARALFGDGDAVGRKLDFLAQEFNREVNTICSKSPSTAVTALGLQMKSVVDQFREQVQNVQ